VIKGRHLLAARHGTQQEHPASEIGERQIVALVVLKANFRRDAWLIGDWQHKRVC
jgi:hypothetical protein